MAEPLHDAEHGGTLAQTIVDTVREPLLVLDRDLCVVVASRSFCRTFRVDSQDVQGRPLYELGNRQFDIPALRRLLEHIVPDHTVMDDFEIAHDVPGIGRRNMLLNARQVFHEGTSSTTLLLAFEDVTDRLAIERERTTLLKQTEELLRQKEFLLQEMQHRVANSLQIIASILMLKARFVTSEETRQHLKDAHRRVLSVAALQEYLQPTERYEQIMIGPYLLRLCDSLAASMISDSRPISLTVQAEHGSALSAHAVSIGLIVTELVINALKHAFPDERQDGQVVVSYEVDGTNWKLAVSDNGHGKLEEDALSAKRGLGTTLITALAHQLDAKVEFARSLDGMQVSITHATFPSRAPLPA
ncbi:MAG: histidine kinase dimerization/phosphoacceptor domain -containing protein [Geminicoccaceae bacterium]